MLVDLTYPHTVFSSLKAESSVVKWSHRERSCKEMGTSI